MDNFTIAGHTFTSRLLVGTGKYANMELMKESVEASGAEIVTVAVRRVALAEANSSILDVLQKERYTFLPNSAGCYTADDAIRYLRLGAAITGHRLVKLEVIGDKTTLLPDGIETLKATEILAKEGFAVMAYTSDDVMLARRLEDAGAAAIMPLAAPIGSGLGVCNPYNIQLIKQQANVPVIVDAGIGTASDATIAMELGADAVLLNTALAKAGDPVGMAVAMKHAVLAGRAAYLAGRMPKRQLAEASSPTEGMMGKEARYV